MSQQTTIRKLAELVNTPVEKLLEQLAQAGMKFSGPDQVVTSAEKVKLLGFLRRSHGKDEPSAEVAEAAPKRIVLNRRKVQEVTVNAGRNKTTVNVEVRQKRSYVKPEGGKVAMTPDEERADILRKLEESRQRNLEEQRMLAEKDRQRDEEIVRQKEAAEEAERKAAEEAAEEAAREQKPRRRRRSGSGSSKRWTSRSARPLLSVLRRQRRPHPRARSAVGRRPRPAFGGAT